MTDENITENKTSSIRYAFSMFGTSIPINFMKTYAPVLYIEQMGVHVNDFSKVLTISSIIDILFIIVFGSISDKYAKDIGRKAWLIFGSPLLSISLILFFNEPLLNMQDNLYFYLLIFYTVTILLDGLININYGALFPELFKSEKDRIKVNAYRQIFQLFAMIISIALTPTLVEIFNFTYVAIAYAILSCVVIVNTALGYKEARMEEENNKQRDSFDLDEVVSVLKNPLLIFYGFSTLFYSVAFSLLTQGLPFFTRYTLEVDNSANTYLFLLLFAMTIISILYFKNNIFLLSSIQMWTLSFVIIAMGYFVILLFSNILGAFLGIMMIGFGVGAMMTSSDIIGVLVIDYDFKKHKKLRTGKFMSIYNILFRANGILVGLAYYLAERFFGFVNLEEVTAVPDQAANFLFLYFPFLMILFGLVLSQLFKYISRNYILGQ